MRIILSGFLLFTTCFSSLYCDLFKNDPKVKVGTLLNGLTYYIHQTAERKNQASISLVVKAGSQSGEKGYAECLERLMTMKNKPNQKIFSFVDRDATFYRIDLQLNSRKTVNDAMNTLSEWAHRSTFRLDRADSKVSRSALSAYYKKWYHPSQMALIIVGDISHREASYFIKRYFSFNSLESPAPLSAVKVRKDEVFNGLEKSVSTMSRVTSLPILSNTKALKNFLLEEICRLVLDKRFWENTESAMFTRELGVLYKEEGLLLKGAPSDEKMRKVIALYQRVPTSEEIDQAIKTLRNKYLLRLTEGHHEDNQVFVKRYQAHYLIGAPFLSSKDYLGSSLKLLNILSLDHCVKFWKEQWSRGPFTYNTSEPTSEPVEARLPVALQSPIIDGIKLLDKQPRAGIILSQLFEEDLAASSLRLKNGMQVIVKPINNGKKSFAIKCFARGGKNLFAKDQLASVSIADEVCRRSGLGPFKGEAFQKTLHDHAIDFHYQTLLSERLIEIKAQSQELKSSFELLHAFFTSKCFDQKRYTEVLDEYRQEKSSSIKQEIFSHMYDHYLVEMPSYKEASYDEARLAIDNLYSDPSEFVVVIAGDFSASEAISHVEKYLASLPTKKTPSRNPTLLKVAHLPRNSTFCGGKRESSASIIYRYDRSLILNPYLLEVAKRCIIKNFASIEGIEVAFNRPNYPDVSECIAIFSISSEKEEDLQIVEDTFSQLVTDGPSEEMVTEIKKVILGEYQMGHEHIETSIDFFYSTKSLGLDPHLVYDYEKRIEEITKEQVAMVLLELFSGRTAGRFFYVNGPDDVTSIIES